MNNQKELGRTQGQPEGGTTAMTSGPPAGDVPGAITDASGRAADAPVALPTPAMEGADCIVRYTSASGPSRSEYCNLADAYDFFNRRLFGNALPPVLITLNHRARNTFGYFHPERFAKRNQTAGPDRLSEISLNPKSMARRSDEDILGTLVHEMAHLWQHAFGKPSRNGYHNREWAWKMKEIGLYPSSTGAAGGRETGQQMTHYILPGRQFHTACEELLVVSWNLEWHAPDEVPLSRRGVGPKPTPESARNKSKFSCSECGQNAWAKPTASLVCGHCHSALVVYARSPSTTTVDRGEDGPAEGGDPVAQSQGDETSDAILPRLAQDVAADAEPPTWIPVESARELLQEILMKSPLERRAWILAQMLASLPEVAARQWLTRLLHKIPVSELPNLRPAFQRAPGVWEFVQEHYKARRQVLRSPVSVARDQDAKRD